MSSRRRASGPRRGRGRRIWLPSYDDMPLSILAMLGGSMQTPKARTTQRKSRGRARTATTPVRGAAPPSEIITVEDTPESTQILNDVKLKVGTFMESGSFISSDEDEVEMVRPKTNQLSAQSFVFLSDDSDDDLKIIPQTSNISNRDSKVSEPSTSIGLNTGQSRNSKSNIMDDDVMEFVESVVSSTNSINESNKDKRNHLKDMKSLEDFRKETEEMLKDASTLLDEIKTGRKAEPPKVDPGSPQVTVGSCPICLESLAGRPASVTVCGHIFCTECIMQTAKNLKKCPTCRNNISAKKFHPIYF